MRKNGKEIKIFKWFIIVIKNTDKHILRFSERHGHATGFKLGLLINFGNPFELERERIIK